jgi:hypothetical protein
MVLLGLWVTNGPMSAQFSPGDLSRAHQNLEGSQNCVKCHEIGKEISGEKCLGCHNEIRKLRDGRLGYHLTVASQQCVDCHKDHLGREAKTVLFQENTFDHSKTGFPIVGKHQSIPCANCHAHKYIRDAGVKEKLDAFPHVTYLGLDQTCSSCHVDPHKGKFRQECSSCHTPVAWAQVKSFDHSITQFPLDGLHVRVACNKCHLTLAHAKATGDVDFSTKTFSDCTPCHASPHRSSFGGQNCKACHTPQSWDAAMGMPFDHELTSYRLHGRHAVLRCEQCHRMAEKKEFRRTFFLSFSKCTDCHADGHNGEFASSYNNDCASCHNEDSYRPSTFTLARHRETRFTLTGAHAATVCSACHLNTETNKQVFHLERRSCESCHKDVHNGKFAASMRDTSCAACHTTAQWKNAAFDHSTTRFALSGKHASVACLACHKDEKDAQHEMQFQKLSTDCESCHHDVHRGQFADDGKTLCNNCHSAEGWKLLSFNHETQSRFSLSGGHKKVPCVSCHREDRVADTVFVRFKPLSSTCESCHQGRNVK